MIATANRPRRVRFDTPLHPSQRLVAVHPARFKILACGRRWGKTRLGALLCVTTAVGRGVAWWVAPTYKIASVGWRQIKRLARQIPGAVVQESERMVTFPGGGWVQVRSADNADSLRGEGLDFLVIDECAFIVEEAWTEALRPALSDRQGRAMFISTPNGFNWFHTLWERGQDTPGDWMSWQFPTLDNPFIEPSEIEAARDTMPEHQFLQEYEAQFLEAAGMPIYLREWWTDRNRFDPDSIPLASVGTALRWISWDTAMSEDDSAAYSAAVVGEIGHDRVLRTREVYRARLSFPDLVSAMEQLADKYNYDGKLAEVIIEDKASGTSAIQTIRAQAPAWLRGKLKAWQPTGSKEYRASQASVWCRNGMVQLPTPTDSVPWLTNFESELFSFPQSVHADQADAFAQLILYLEPWLEAGWLSRRNERDEYAA